MILAVVHARRVEQSVRANAAGREKYARPTDAVLQIRSAIIVAVDTEKNVLPSAAVYGIASSAEIAVVHQVKFAVAAAVARTMHNAVVAVAAIARTVENAVVANGVARREHTACATVAISQAKPAEAWAFFVLYRYRASEVIQVRKSMLKEENHGPENERTISQPEGDNRRCRLSSTCEFRCKQTGRLSARALG